MSIPSGHPLAYLRHQRGWTLRQVAEMVSTRSGLNMAAWRQKVHRWECDVTPERAAQHALATVFGIDPGLIDQVAWPGWLLAACPAEPTDADWTTQNARDILGTVVASAGMDRRGFLALSSTALAVAFSQAPPAQIGSGLSGHTIGGDAIAHLRGRVEQLWHLDDSLGGGHCLPVALADLNLVHTLLRSARYTSATERHLLDVAAAIGRMAGWVAFDSGLHSAAQRHWHAALRCSHAAGATSESAYTLSNLALQAIYTGTGRDAVDLLAAARNTAGTSSATVTAMLDTWDSRAHALLGEHRQAELLLHQADETYDGRHSEDDPAWIYWMPQPSLTAEAGTAMLHTGNTALAERMLHDGLATLDADSTRDSVLYLVRLAEVQLTDGHADQAAATANRALAAATGIDSYRIDRQITDVIDAFPPGPWEFARGIGV